MYNRDEYRRNLSYSEQDVGWTLKKVFFKLIIPLMIFVFAISVAGHIFGWFNSAVEVASEQTNPRELLKSIIINVEQQ